jgi:hypothetical protein
MQVIRSPADAANIADSAIRQMILQRINAIASDEPYDETLHGYFLIIDSRRRTTLRRVRRVSSQVFRVQCITACHNRCPPAAPRQNTFAATRRTRRLVAIPMPSSGQFRRGSSRSKTAIRKPLLHIEISPGNFDAPRKVRKGVRRAVQGISAKKKGLTNLALVGL